MPGSLTIAERYRRERWENERRNKEFEGSVQVSLPIRFPHENPAPKNLQYEREETVEDRFNETTPEIWE